MATWASIKRSRSKVSGPALVVGGPDEHISNIVLEGWRQLSDNFVKLPDPHEFRSSLLPYCPILSLMVGNYKELCFGNDFYLVSGTAQHILYQRWLPFTKWGANIWGDWYCLDCKTHYLQQIHPQKCQQCQSQNIIYVEIEVSLRQRLALLTGHLDLVYCLPDGVIIIDIKTCMERRLNGSKLPYANHLHQIYSYCYMFEDNFRIPVHGLVLAYVPRELDNAGFTENFVAIPSTYLWGRTWDNKLRQITRQRLSRALAGRDAELQIRKNGLTITAVQTLIENRFCKSYKEARNWQDSNLNKSCKFWNGEVCRLASPLAIKKEMVDNKNTFW